MAEKDPGSPEGPFKKKPKKHDSTPKVSKVSGFLKEPSNPPPEAGPKKAKRAQNKKEHAISTPDMTAVTVQLVDCHATTPIVSVASSSTILGTKRSGNPSSTAESSDDSKKMKSSSSSAVDFTPGSRDAPYVFSAPMVLFPVGEAIKLGFTSDVLSIHPGDLTRPLIDNSRMILAGLSGG